MNTAVDIKKLFEQGAGVLTSQELEEGGVSYYHIRKLIDNKKVERIKQGLYRWLDEESDELVEAQKIVPQGVFCLFSAALLHELSTSVPSEYHMAIPRKDKVTLPDYPPIKIYYWDDTQYNLGHVKITKQNAGLNVYGLEKTVCDFIKFRNKVGLDVTKEVLKNYLAHRERNLNDLMVYAKQMGISTIVRQYLEILV